MKVCLFCLARPTKPSDEHLFPKWIRRLLPSQKFSHTRTTRLDGSPMMKTWINKDIDIKVKAVCENCNGGWMSDLETGHAKPAMKDMILSLDSVPLTPQRIASISAFAFKTAAVASGMVGASSTFLKKERRRFAKTLEVPPEVHIFIASYFGERKTSGDLSLYTYQSSIPGGDALDLYALTWRTQHFVFQVVNPRITFSPNRNFVDYNFECNVPMSAFVSRIWPPGESDATWPPPENLGDHSFKAFCNRWNDLRFSGR